MEKMRGREISLETSELLKHPHRVFDSDLNVAQQQAAQVMRRIEMASGLHTASHGVEVRISPRNMEGGGSTGSEIQITWAEMFDNTGIALKLTPITEGKGAEGGVLAYQGSYGQAEKNKKGNFVLVDDPSRTVSLEKLFKVPSGIQLLIKPTETRWAIGNDELSLAYGENVRTLYMGLGFLLSGESGHKWMLVGMHEAGHLPRQPDENLAWSTAVKNYANIYRGKPEIQKQILKGESRGRFTLMEKPRGPLDLTVGKIMQYGLTSHALAGNAKISSSWGVKAEKTMADFHERIIDAQTSFDSLIR